MKSIYAHELVWVLVICKPTLLVFIKKCIIYYNKLNPNHYTAISNMKNNNTGHNVNFPIPKLSDTSSDFQITGRD